MLKKSGAVACALFTDVRATWRGRCPENAWSTGGAESVRKRRRSGKRRNEIK